MGSISKRRKLIKIERNKEDRITTLPNSLIGHILSFLPTKDAVATSLLSTKWKYHWTSITNVDFDDWLECCKPTVGMRKSFISFVYRVLLLRNVSDMHKFRLNCTKFCESSHLDHWVYIATLHNVREVDICLRFNEHVMLPCELMTCNTLVVLKLEGYFVLNVPSLVCLQSLKILHLDTIEFWNDDSIERLFSSCPVLEDLSIIGCNWDNINVLNISALLLKSLTIDCKVLDWENFHTLHCNYKIVFNTPNLQYLKYFDYVAEGYSLNNFNSLVKADINLVLSSEVEIDNFIRDKSVEEVNVVKLLGGISKVQRLYLHADSIEALQMCSLPIFYHLSYLELGKLSYGDKAGWEVLPKLLESSPRLETLVCEELLFSGVSICEEQLYNGDDDDDGDDGFIPYRFGWHTPRNVPSCLLFHLKVVEIKYFLGRTDELKMAKYFLKNAKVLQRLTIRSPWFWYKRSKRSRRSKICNILLRLPRGSKTCRLEVV